MSRDYNAEQSHSMKTDNSYFDRVEDFKYLGTNFTNQNSIQEEIKSTLKSGNACYHSVQNLLSSSLLNKYTKIKIYRTIILPVVLYGCETWSLTFREGLTECVRIGFEENIWA
jgi:UDP-galactopyranose mutase